MVNAEQWRMEQMMKYLQEEAEINKLESDLEGDYSLEKIHEVINRRLYSKGGNDENARSVS